MHQTLHARFRNTVALRGANTALIDGDGRSVSYAELGELASGIRNLLFERGIQPGDRVGFFLKRSIDALAILFGTLEAGGIYVPADPSIPPKRAGTMFSDCKASIIFVDRAIRAELESACQNAGLRTHFVELDFTDVSELPLRRVLRESKPRSPKEPIARQPTDPAFMLYTSGSTGVPKGVLANHIHADALVDWCVDALPVSDRDRFSMVTPFSFAFSILDIHTTVRLGATGVIVPDSLLRAPKELVKFVVERKITVWASVPSTLNLIASTGEFEKTDRSQLRLILFAGEEYPIEQLRLLSQQLPDAALYNLFGTTETGVCLNFRIPNPIPDSQTRPFPMGEACSNIRTRLGKDIPDQELEADEGELQLSGPGVMIGYWNRPELNRDKLIPDESGALWYRTGDLVQEIEPGSYLYISRIDRMIKKRGFRIEPGEIENHLYRHPQIDKAAVLGKKQSSGDTSIIAFVVAKGSEPSMIALKKFCAESLPGYMIPDQFVFLPEMPLSSPSKIDIQKLAAMLSGT